MQAVRYSLRNVLLGIRMPLKKKYLNTMDDPITFFATYLTKSVKYQYLPVSSVSEFFTRPFPFKRLPFSFLRSLSKAKSPSNRDRTGGLGMA